MPLLTVIMPTRNAARYLEACLDSYRAQTFDDWELICVDRNSTDGTLEILQRYASSWPRLRILNGGHERTSQINIAVRSSTSKYLYYTGADFRVDPTMLEDAVKTAEREKADAVWINCISEDNGFWGRVRHFERETYVGSVDFESARFFTREMYERVGGYDDTVPVFEEYDLQDRMMAAGARFTRITTASEHHLDEPERLSQIWWRSYYIGSLYRNLVSKQGAPALRHLNPVRRTFFKNPKRYFQHPILTAGFITLLLAKYGGGAAGILISFLPPLLRPKR